MEEKQVLVRIEDLCKYFRLSSKEELKAVDHVSFDIFRNETVGIVGESGCGKTTLGRTVLGLYPATSGRVLFDGMDVHSAGKREMREFKKRAQIMLQDPYASLNPRMTVGEIIKEPMEIHGILDSSKDREDRAAELLKTVGLKPDHIRRYPHEFSGGQRQRLTIARALVGKPEILVMDDSASALDFATDAALRHAIHEQTKGMTVFIVSQRATSIKQADKILVLDDGALAGVGTHKELMESCQVYREICLSQLSEQEVNR